jgi:hypothetical protein
MDDDEAVHPSADADPPATRADSRTFRTGLAVVAIVALVIRVVNVVFTTRRVLFSDAGYYHLQAGALAKGYFFSEPFGLLLHHRDVPSAFHPPLFSAVLSVGSVLGLGTLDEHRILAGLIGVGTVVAIGYLGRRIGGVGVGLTAAAIAAVYPNLWQIDGTLMSEDLAACLATLVLIQAYRTRERPTPGRFAALGALIGVAMLSRPETGLLLALIVLPLAWTRTIRARPARSLALTALAVGTAIVIVTPWVVRNLTTFERPVTISSNGDAVLAYANCPTTYYLEQYLGSWSPGCSDTRFFYGRAVVDPKARPLEESVRSQKLRDRGLDYARAHLGRLLAVVVPARVARVWDLYPDPMNNLGLTESEERAHVPALIGLLMYWVLAVAAVFGAVILHRRRGPPLWPLLTPFVVVTVVAVYAYGAVRFRAIAEPAIIVLAAVAFVAAFRRLRGSPAPAPAD